MSPRQTLIAAATLAAFAVVLGAFAAHALHDELAERGQLENWRTAVRYQMWHALALGLVYVLRQGREGLRFASWAFLVGSVLFSGSIYCLAFDALRPVMIPLTPLGGSLLIAGWVSIVLWTARPGSTSS